ACVVAFSLPQGAIVLTVGGCSVEAVEPFRTVDFELKAVVKAPCKPVSDTAFRLPEPAFFSEIVVFSDVPVAV
ncbi:MAG: hypothetical protein IJ727_08640, partial [Treponema sp.]|nr:hypothetical protein [Treponema sp.]